MTKGPHTWPKEKKTWREVYQEWLESGLQPGGLMLDAINQNKEKIRRKQVLRRKCNITLTRGGMYRKLRPPRTERFAEVLIMHPEAREIEMALLSSV